MPYAKTVLLIDDSETKLVKNNPFLQHRMGADNHIHGSGTDFLQSLFSGLCRGRTGKINGAEAQPLKPGLKLQKMLFGKNFRWRDHRDLGVVFDGHQGAHQGHDRFAATDIALQQSIHRMRRHHVLLDFVQNPALSCG